MDREEIYKEIESMFGLVPSMFKELPDSMLGLEWNLFKRVQIEEGAVPNKYRELLDLPCPQLPSADIACSFTRKWQS